MFNKTLPPLFSYHRNDIANHLVYGDAILTFAQLVNGIYEGANFRVDMKSNYDMFS